MPKDKNIFETAASQLGKKSVKDTNIPAPTPSASAKTPPEPNRETTEMLAKIAKMKQDLQSKVQYIESKCEEKGQLNIKRKLSPTELNAIEKSKELLESKVWKSVGLPQTLSLPVNTSNSAQTETETVQKGPTNRKGKTLGARKKWLPIR